MCQTQPGPRCAGYVRKERAAVHDEINQTHEQIEQVTGRPGADKDMKALYEKKRELGRKIVALDEAWDETKEGQAELAKKTDALRARYRQASAACDAARAAIPPNTVYLSSWQADDAELERLNTEPQVDAWSNEPVAEPKTFVRGPRPDEAERDALTRAGQELASVSARKSAAAKRRQAKVEALKCQEAGDELGRDITLKHGPGTAWMKHSSINPMGRTAEGEERHISPGLAISVVQEDRTVEHDYAGNGYDVAMGSVVIEQPISQSAPAQDLPNGHHLPARHVVGDHPMGNMGPLVVSEGNGGTVSSYCEPDSMKSWKTAVITNSTPQSYGTELHEDTVKELMPEGVSDNAEVTWGEPTIIRDASGKGLLMRTEGTWEAQGGQEGRGRRRY